MVLFFSSNALKDGKWTFLIKSGNSWIVGTWSLHMFVSK